MMDDPNRHSRRSPANTKGSNLSEAGTTPPLCLTPMSRAQETVEWLSANGFQEFEGMFAKYSGIDMLRLSKADFREMCGISKGNRLYDALRRRSPSRLRLYIKLDHESFYRAIFLEVLSYDNLVKKLSVLVRYQPSDINQITVTHTSGITVLINDDIVKNMADEGIYSLKTQKQNKDDMITKAIRSSVSVPEDGGGDDGRRHCPALIVQLKERDPNPGLSL